MILNGFDIEWFVSLEQHSLMAKLCYLKRKINLFHSIKTQNNKDCNSYSPENLSRIYCPTVIYSQVLEIVVFVNKNCPLPKVSRLQMLLI